jgi:Primase C terminal 2 (PriCT-2)
MTELRTTGSLFESVTSTDPEHFDLELGEFANFLQDAHKRDVCRKSNNQLISAASFNGPRRKENVRHCQGIWLDFDDGNFSHKQFHKKFPSLAFLCFSTFSAGPSADKWRAFIPTDRPMTADEYELIYRYFIKVGTPTDPQCSNANRIMFLPCQSAAGAEFSWFRMYGSSDGEVLGVDLWMPVVQKAMRHRKPNCSEAQAAETEYPISRLRALLENIDPDHPKWFEVTCGIKHAFGDAAFEIWDSWSAKGNKYNAATNAARWNSLRDDHARPITMGTVIQISRQSAIEAANAAYTAVRRAR